ncbi:MAG: sugar ABC transporter permease [Clostridiales bacterium]|nr:sugar ABC transporter permease [Clostridiales bacterium]
MKKNKWKKEYTLGILFASIPVIGIFLFAGIPLLLSLYLSVTKLNGYVLENATFLGIGKMFSNYGYILSDPLFWKSMGNTFYAALALPISIGLGLLISVMLNRKIKGKFIYRTIFFIPYVCSVIALVITFRTIYNYNYGPLNDLLQAIGLDRVRWLGDSRYFMPAMILMGVWTGMGFNIILYSAALTNVPESLYEAATIDGASKTRQFFSITLPLVSPTTFYLLVMGLIGSLQDFSRFQAMAPDGGPGNAGLTMVFYLYNMGFSNTFSFGMGYASAAAWIVAVLIISLTALNFFMSKRWVYND